MEKLQQNQVWKQGERYLRIVQLERMTVDYKLMQNLAVKEGSHHQTTKKEFCRLLKGATLLSHEEAQSLSAVSPPVSDSPAILSPAPEAEAS